MVNRQWRRLALMAVLGLGACDAGLNGRYQDEQGTTIYEFNSDGRVYISVFGVTVPAEYSIDGNKVIVTSPQGTVVLSSEQERLFGPMGLELMRQPDPRRG